MKELEIWRDEDDIIRCLINLSYINFIIVYRDRIIRRIVKAHILGVFFNQIWEMILLKVKAIRKLY